MKKSLLFLRPHYPCLKFSLTTLLLTMGFLGCSSLHHKSACQPQSSTLNEKDFAVEITTYLQSSAADKTIVIIPPTGGTNLIDRSYAKRFCDEGFNVYIVNDWSRPNEKTSNLEYHQIFYTNSARALGMVLGQIQTHFIGVLGTSVGALHSIVASAKFKQIDAVYSIAGGFPLSEIAVKSDQDAMRDLRAWRLKHYSLKNDEEYLQALKAKFALESETLNSIDLNKKYGLTIVDQDTTVPVATQLQLKELWHASSIVHITGGHTYGIIKMWLFHTAELVNFFKEAYLTSSKDK